MQSNTTTLSKNQRSTNDTIRRIDMSVEQFWEEQASMLNWQTPWHTVKNTSFDQNSLHISWFEGATLNVSENCIDRHLADRANKAAIIWEADDPAKPSRSITYQELHQHVSRCANMLISLGVSPSDRVTIYMPMIPEAVIAMLACARIGAMHSVVFGGFSAQALRSRIEDCDSHIVITADAGMRGGKMIPLKSNVDEALIGNTIVEKVLVFKHTDTPIEWNETRDVWWHSLSETVSEHCPAIAYDTEQPLFVLYTSGSTGQPKGLVHSSGGYLLYAMHTFKHVFDYRENDVFWCSADIGWITGHSYIVYGPLAAGATTVMFEGVPTYPDAGRFWDVIEKHKVSTFYTAPTAIRMLMREGDAFVNKHDRSSLRVLGSVGEPINPEAWYWYHDVVGEKRCHIVDTWWQTETGGHMITPIAGEKNTPAGSATRPYYGIDPVLCKPDGTRIEGAGSGALCICDSWPGQARTIWGDHQRFIDTYFSAFPGYYFSGDAARRNEDGNYWIEGRMDDVINMAGHRLGTAEVEAAINEHPKIVESAVVAIPNEIKGQAIYGFVIMQPHEVLTNEVRREVNALLRKDVGPIASIQFLQHAPSLPKTRSGKIMRRILRKVASGEVKDSNDYDKLGDTSTLVNPEHIDEIVAGRLVTTC